MISRPGSSRPDSDHINCQMKAFFLTERKIIPVCKWFVKFVKLCYCLSNNFLERLYIEFDQLKSANAYDGDWWLQIQVLFF